MRKKFKTIAEIDEYCEGSGWPICMMGKDFISFGTKDLRGPYGWRVEHVIKHSIKNTERLNKLFERHKISHSAINSILD